MNPRRLTKVEREIYQEARRFLAQGASAVQFSDRYFGSAGRLRVLWKTEPERRSLANSEIFRWLQERLADLRRREGEAFTKEVEALSGRLTVVVPRSLHAALKCEAVNEGVSLAELIRLKLGLPYRIVTRILGAGGGGNARPASLP